MSIFTISDLHLSLGSNKPMNIFRGWENHTEKLVANWKIITYTITYVANGATLPSGNPTTYTVDSDIKLKPASMAGKVFDGWEIKGEKETYCADTIARGTIGNLTLSPTWDESAIVLGRHEQDGNTDNGKEEIVWIKVKEKDGVILITADHGNAEQMIDPSDKSVFTAHTTNVVPLIVSGMGDINLKPGRLADLAPTMLDIMNLEIPAEMSGESLIVK